MSYHDHFHQFWPILHENPHFAEKCKKCKKRKIDQKWEKMQKVEKS